jgi:Na+-translocating ferredoxin:NAD+ oxidoreductase RnfC subunit
LLHDRNYYHDYYLKLANDCFSSNNINDVIILIIDAQEKRLAQEISALEEDTGVKLRVLAQNYPDTPGL